MRSRKIAVVALAIAMLGGSMTVLLSQGLASATTTAENTAITWARSQIGTDVDPILCLSFVRSAWASAGIPLKSYINVKWNGDSYPQNIWGHFTHGTTGGANSTPPPGALVFFNYKKPGDIRDSHVMLSLGGGNNVSTADAYNENSVHYETLSQEAASGAFSTYVGWWLPDGSRTSGSAIKPKPRNYGFDEPLGIAVSGSRVWVANISGGSVTEFNASNGSLVRDIKSSADKFNGPWSIAVSGSHVWVANLDGRSITELNATNGSLVRVIPFKNGAPQCLFVNDSHLWALEGDSVVEYNTSNGLLVRVINAPADQLFGTADGVVVGADLWVTNDEGNTITELNTSNGSLVRVIDAAVDMLSSPEGIAVDGSHVWVANASGRSVTELNALDGSLVQVINSPQDQFSFSDNISASGSHLWVTSEQGPTGGSSSITELNASDGSLVQVINAPAYRLFDPGPLSILGSHIWVANNLGNSVTEISSADGSLIRVIG